VTPAESDPDHWLYRLSEAEWLAAAETELVHCEEALGRRAVRPGVTHARRGAGMALNALLRRHEDPRYGRSYMEHVMALAGDDQAPADVRAAAEDLRQISPLAPALLSIGKPDLRALEAARAIVAYVRAQLRENG
jgi:hypothetical protein